MREEHHPSSVPSWARRRHGEFVFADLPSSFFLPRYLRLPDICTHHAAEARLEREEAGILICRAFCARENARRVLIAAWLSHAIYSPIRWKRIYHSFSFPFFSPSPSPSLLHSFPLSPLTDSACTSQRARSHTNLHENVAKGLINLTQENANSAIKLNPIFLSLSRRGFIKRPFRLPPREENSCCW